MQVLPVDATAILMQLIDTLQEGYGTEITKKGHLPLVVQLMNENIATPAGTAKLYSLYQYYLQEGDRMYNPEMWFLIIDKREDPAAYEKVYAYPVFYQISALGYYRYAATIEDGRVESYSPVAQAKQVHSAEQWLFHLRGEGFL